MNTHDKIELPPLPTEGGLQEAIRLGPDFVGSLMQSYARSSIAAYQQGGNAKQYYDEIMKDYTEEPDPIEDLRFFCSLAMRQQDWLDVEPFFDAIIADRQRRSEPVKYWLCCGSTDHTHADRKQPDCYDPDKAKFGTAESHKALPAEPLKAKER